MNRIVRFRRTRYVLACLLVGLANVSYLLGAVFAGLGRLCETWADDLEA